MTDQEYKTMIQSIVVPDDLPAEEKQKRYLPLNEYLQSNMPALVYRFRRCSDRSISELCQCIISFTHGDRMNDDFDGMLYFDRDKILFCSSFRKDSDVCSAHFIREKIVEQLVLESLQRVFAMIQVFEKRFAQEQMAAYNKERQKELAEKRRKLNAAQKRIAEIDGLIQRIYEDNASGKLSDDRYATMSIAYENEQRALKESLSTLSEDLRREMDSSEGLQQFIDRVKQTVRPTVLTPELVHGFIEKIVVHAPVYDENRKRTQMVDIYYNGVGIIPNYSLEGMEQAVKDWQKKHAETVKTA